MRRRVLAGQQHGQHVARHVVVVEAAVALVGGRGSIIGPILGALLLRPVGDFCRIYFGDTLPGLHLVIFGLVLILVMLFQPRGIQEPISRAYQALLNRLIPQPTLGR